MLPISQAGVIGRALFLLALILLIRQMFPWLKDPVQKIYIHGTGVKPLFGCQMMKRSQFIQHIFFPKTIPKEEVCGNVRSLKSSKQQKGIAGMESLFC